MLRELLTGKLHRATVTDCDLHYEGSIAIDAELLDAAGIRVYQKVDIYNINTGQRFSTYAIAASRGSRRIGVNGAAARLCQRGDRIIVACYAHLDDAESLDHHPSVIVLDERNEPVSIGSRA